MKNEALHSKFAQEFRQKKKEIAQEKGGSSTILLLPRYLTRAQWPRVLWTQYPTPIKLPVARGGHTTRGERERERCVSVRCRSLAEISHKRATRLF